MENEFVNPLLDTVTWLEGDRLNACDLIQERMVKTVRLNPWMMRSYVRVENAIHIAYKEDRDHTQTSSTGSKEAGIHETDPLLRCLKERGMLVLVDPKESSLFFGMSEEAHKDYKDTLTEYILRGKNEFNHLFWKVVVVPCS